MLVFNYLLVFKQGTLRVGLPVDQFITIFQQLK